MTRITACSCDSGRPNVCTDAHVQKGKEKKIFAEKVEAAH